MFLLYEGMSNSSYISFVLKPLKLCGKKAPRFRVPELEAQALPGQEGDSAPPLEPPAAVDGGVPEGAQQGPRRRILVAVLACRRAVPVPKS